MIEESHINERTRIVEKVVKGAGFHLGALLIIRALSLCRLMIFARLFMPEEIGTAALAVTCISIVSVLSDFGFYQSVIREKEPLSNLRDTAFTLSLILSGCLVGFALLGAPIFSYIFSTNLDRYFRFLVFMVFSIPFNFPIAFWEKELKFVQTSVPPLLSELGVFIITVLVEVQFHAGIWSLLIGQLGGFLLASLFIWIFAEIRPHLYLDMNHVRQLLKFGTPFMIQNLNGMAMQRGDNLIVAGVWGLEQYAYYNFAWQLPLMISTIASTVDGLLFPVYARLNERKEDIHILFNLSNKMWSILGAFIGFGMILYARMIVNILYSDKWLPVVPILQIMALSFMLRFCSGYGYDNLVLVRGRTTYMMKWGFFNTFLVFTLGWWMINALGPRGGAWFWVLQAAVLIPLVRVPLIYQELNSLEYLYHVWQPVASGVIAFLFGYFLLSSLPAWGTQKVIMSVCGYGIIYIFSLILLDHRLIRSFRNIWLLLKNTRNVKSES